MKILLLGATGHVGSRVLDEALDRGHEVTGVARHIDSLSPQDNLNVVQADASDTDTVTQLANGHDAIAVAISNRGKGGTETYLKVIRATLDAAQRSDADRVLIVGGAGSLKVSPDTELVDTPDFPEEWKDEALAGREARDIAQKSDANWTFLSPPALLEPGERTGNYRVGGRYLLIDDEGNSQISMEDFAVALVDELENADHEREQFTVAY